MKVSSHTESSTEVASTQMVKDQKTPEDRATIIRNKDKRKFVDFIGGCLHGRFQEHVFSRRFRTYILPRQSLWITMAVCLTIVTVYLLSNVVQHRLHQKTIVHSHITTEKTLPFPAVTICSQEPFQKNKLKQYQSQTESTPSTNPINDFNAVWEIYELEEALKLHAEQPSCEDNISNVQCSLKPAQCSMKEDSNLQTGMPNYRNIRPQSSLHNSVLSNIDLSLTSPLLYHFPMPILKPRSLSISLTSTILEPSFSQLLEDFIVNNFGNLVNMCYGDRLSAESTWKFVMDCFDDPVCSDKVSLYTFLSLTWIDDEIIAYFSEIVDNFSSPDMIHGYATDSFDHSVSEVLYNHFPGQIYYEMIPYVSAVYNPSLYLDSYNPYYAQLYSSTFSFGIREYLEALYYLFPDYTYIELVAYLHAYHNTYSTDDMQHDSSTYSFGIREYLDTFYYLFPGYTYHELLAYLSIEYATYSADDMLHDSSTNSYGIKEYLDTLYNLYSDYTYHEILAHLYIDYSTYSADDMLHDSPTNSYLFQAYLDTLYYFFPDYTYHELLAYLHIDVMLHDSSTDSYGFQEYLDTLYYFFPDYTYYEILASLSIDYSTYMLHDSSTNSYGMKEYLETLYFIFPDYTYYEILAYLSIDYSTYSADDILHDSSTNSYGMKEYLETLSYLFPDYTYHELLASLSIDYSTYSADDMLHDFSTNSYGIQEYLETLYYLFPDYTYHEILAFLYIDSSTYSADSMLHDSFTDDMLLDSSIVDMLYMYSSMTYGMKEYLDTLYYHLPDYTYTEIIAYLLAPYSYYSTDSSTKSYGWSMYLDTLYYYFDDYTYYEIIEILDNYETYSSSDDTLHNSFGFSMSLETLYSYYPGQTYNEIMAFLDVLYGSSNRQGRLYDYYEWETLYKVLDREHALGYNDTLQAMYSLYPEYSFTAIMDLLTNEACAVLPDITYNPETQALQEGHALHQEYEEEIDMLRMLVFGSPFEDPMDLIQWSSISTRQIEEFGFTYSELISDCSYNGETCDQSDFTKWSNDRYGNCFTFNSQFNSEIQPREANQRGKQNGLKLVLNTMEERPSGYRISIHHAAEVPMPEENGIEVSAERTSVLSTSAQLHERITEPRGTCKEIEWALGGSQTLDGCKKVCQEEMIRLNCKCKKIILEMKEDIEEQLPECSSRNMQCLRDVTEQYNRNSCSHCFAPCQEITYKTEVSEIESLQTNRRCIDDLTMKPNEYRKTSLSAIYVYLENLQIEKLREIPSYPLYNAVMETGIWIYVFLGLSMLGLLTFIFELLIMLASENNNPINEDKTVTIKYMRKEL